MASETIAETVDHIKEWIGKGDTAPWPGQKFYRKESARKKSQRRDYEFGDGGDVIKLVGTECPHDVMHR